jgi:hypothetical protein
MHFRQLRFLGVTRVGIFVSAIAFLTAAGSASAAYVFTTDEPSNITSDVPVDVASARATVATAQAQEVAALIDTPLEVAQDPKELHAAAEATALAERLHAEAVARAEDAARAEAEAAQLRAAQEREAALAAERARMAQEQAAARAAAAAQAAAAATAEATVESALVQATGSIQQAAAAAGWPSALLAKVERVVMCESGGRTTAVSPAGYVGLMQVAPWLHGAVPGDAVGQLAQAYGVYLAQGWGAWPVCGA